MMRARICLNLFLVVTVILLTGCETALTLADHTVDPNNSDPAWSYTPGEGWSGPTLQPREKNSYEQMRETYGPRERK